MQFGITKAKTKPNLADQQQASVGQQLNLFTLLPIQTNICVDDVSNVAMHSPNTRGTVRPRPAVHQYDHPNTQFYTEDYTACRVKFE
jgi:hypothetical protein